MSGRRLQYAALLLICALAFALRLYQLDGQSMWSDEGLSLYRAQLALPALLANQIVVDGVPTTDTNPPLYFLLLAGWRALAGESVFLLRFAGAALATLATPLLYVTGRLLGGPAVGLAAALLLALSPLHVWQAQEMRNYGPLLTLNLATIYALFRFLAGARSWRWLALGLLAALAGIYTHFFGFFLFAFVLLALATALLAEQGRLLLRRRWFWLALAGAVLLLLPVAPLALERFRAGQQIDFVRVPALDVVHHALGAFGVGVSPTVTHPWWLWLPAALLALLGLVIVWRRSRAAFWLLLGYQVTPLALLLLLSLVNPLYNGVRHLLIGLPPFLLLAAWGMAGGRGLLRRVGLTLGVAVLIIQTGWLWQQYHAPALQRDDIRGAAAFLNEVARPGDAVVLHDTLISFTFDHYYDGAAPVVSIPRFGEISEAATLQRLQEVGEQADIVWFLVQPPPRTGFDRARLSDWARTHWLEVASRSFPWLWLPVHLTGFVADPYVNFLPAAATVQEAEWPGVLRLHGYELPASLASGSTAWPTFYLEQQGAGARQYSLSVRFAAGDETWATAERVLGGALHPTGSWEPDSIVRLPMPLTVAAGLPSGSYQLWLQLVETETGQLAPLADGSTELLLGEWPIQAADCTVDTEFWPAPPIPAASFGEALQLVGYELPDAEYRPGHLLSAELLWCLQGESDQDYSIRLELADQVGNVVATGTQFMGRPVATAGGQLLLLRSGVAVPAAADPGRYRVRVSVLEAASGEPLRFFRPWPARSLTLGEVEVTAWPLQTTAPPVDHLLQASFGEPPQVTLHGYRLEERLWPAGASVPLTLVWRSQADLDGYWDVLVHLVDANGAIAAQGDGPPTGGFRPTSSWREGEIIVDERQLLLPADLAPGRYELWTGLYHPDTGARLPAFSAGQRQADDRVLLGTLTVAAGDG